MDKTLNIEVGKEALERKIRILRSLIDADSKKRDKQALSKHLKALKIHENALKGGSSK